MTNSNFNWKLHFDLHYKRIPKIAPISPLFALFEMESVYLIIWISFAKATNEQIDNKFKSG